MGSIPIIGSNTIIFLDNLSFKSNNLTNWSHGKRKI